jgi:hypothetical protein
MAELTVTGIGKPMGKQVGSKFETTMKDSTWKLDPSKDASKDLPLDPSKYTVVDLKGISCASLEADETFNTLKRELDLFNNHVRKCAATDTELPSYGWKHTLYIGLKNLMCEIAVTEDKPLQQKFLGRVNTWFYDELIRKEGPLPPREEKKPKQIAPKGIDDSMLTGREAILNNQYLMQTNPDLLLPSEYRAATLKDYEEGARTKHSILEPPYERLNEFERKFPNSILKPQSREGRPKTQGKSTSFAEANMKTSPPKIDPAKQGTPLPVDPNAPSPIPIVQEAGGEGGEGGEGGDDEGGDGGGEDGDGPVGQGEAGEGAPKVVKPPTVQLRKLFANDDITSKKNDIRDQRIPMEYRSNYAYYTPTGNIEELALEQRWRDGQNKKLMDKREQEELTAVMKEWSFAKSRIEEESVRKNESMTYGSRFETRAFKPRVLSAITTGSAQVYSPIKNTRKLTSSQGKKRESDGEEQAVVNDGERERQELEQVLDYESDEEFHETPSQYLNISKMDPKSIFYEDKMRPKTSGHLPRLVDYSNVVPVGMATGEIIPGKENKLIENEMSRLKIERLRKMHANILNHSKAQTVGGAQTDNSLLIDKSQRGPSLSVYDSGIKASSYRPFSAIYQKVNDISIRTDQLNEVEEVKKKLAKFRINVPMRTLATSLLVPDKIPVGQLKPLPEPGLGLLKNPFYKEKKGKKKKKKKKKK